MKRLYFVVITMLILGLYGCYESRIVTILDRDGIEKPVKTVKAGSILFPGGSDVVFSGKSGNIISFDIIKSNNVDRPSPYRSPNDHFELDLSKSDIIGIHNRTIRVVGASKNKLMYIDYSKYR